MIRSASPKRTAKLEELLADLRILILGKEEAEEEEAIIVDLTKKGKTVEMRDALIAGCMLRNAYPSIVTRNIEDFSRIAKIEVVSY